MVRLSLTDHLLEVGASAPPTAATTTRCVTLSVRLKTATALRKSSAASYWGGNPTAAPCQTPMTNLGTHHLHRDG